jgi:hypothetical protein
VTRSARATGASSPSASGSRTTERWTRGAELRELDLPLRRHPGSARAAPSAGPKDRPGLHAAERKLCPRAQILPPSPPSTTSRAAFSAEAPLHP